jgi:hypothetical protein
VRDIGLVGGVNASDFTLREEPALALDPLLVKSLNKEQRRAYEIVKTVVVNSQRGQETPQLLMLLHGEGGTGKSRVIQTITMLFKQAGMEDRLAKMAYTGVAASLIEGETIHKATKMSDGNNNPKGRALHWLQKKWDPKLLLIIDEDSMVSKEFLAKIARNISVGRAEHGRMDLPFGGLNVLMCGDFHQFPPVAAASDSALYALRDNAKQIAKSTGGRTLYQSFDKCVLLKQQKRVKDPEWHTFLQRLRQSNITSDDIEMLRSLIIKENEFKDASSGWQNAKLVTPRHVVREAWNKRALREHSLKTGNQIFSWDTLAILDKRELTINER